MSTHIDILLVDDDPGIRDVFAMLLEEQYSLQTAANGEEALAILHTYTPRLLLTDLQMPRMGGEELYLQLTQLKLRQQMKVIVMSSEQTVTQIAAELGADNALRKPFGIEALESLLNTYLVPLAQAS